LAPPLDLVARGLLADARVEPEPEDLVPVDFLAAAELDLVAPLLRVEVPLDRELELREDEPAERELPLRGSPPVERELPLRDAPLLERDPLPRDDDDEVEPPLLLAEPSKLHLPDMTR
jgi:hypothetical protein